MKAYLYKQILSSLAHTSDDIETQLSEQIMYARLLYNKGLYMQALKILDKVKTTAKNYNQSTYRVQALIFEKKIESMHITRSMEGRSEALSRESNEVNRRIFLLDSLSGFALQLYSWYIQHGHARDEKDEKAVHDFFYENLPGCKVCEMDFYERLYYYQAYCWYSFILQDLLSYYRYSQKWVDLFEEPGNPHRDWQHDAHARRDVVLFRQLFDLGRRQIRVGAAKREIEVEVQTHRSTFRLLMPPAAGNVMRSPSRAIHSVPVKRERASPR